MRLLKASVLGLALLGGGCGETETARQDKSTPPSADPRITTSAGGKTAASPRAMDPQPPPQTNKSSLPRENKDDAIKRDLQRLQGTWTAVDIEHDGGKETPKGGLKWVVRNDGYETWIDNKKVEICQFTLDPTQKPKTIVIRPGGGLKGPRITGIYELDGATLKVCYDMTGRGYPSEFSAPKGARRITYAFRRE
jgi:uncharacterized protein (TIGR03067 family)